MTDAAIISLPVPSRLTPKQTNLLVRTGEASPRPGVTVYSPLQKAAAKIGAPMPAAGVIATNVELASLTIIATPLAEAEQKLRELEEKWRDACANGDRSQRAELEREIDAVKESLPELRGNTRRHVLQCITDMQKRAASDYAIDCATVANSAAKLEALGTLRDDLLRTNTFDPLCVWAKASALLAPSVEVRPAGRITSPDAWGRDCYWTPSSAMHREEVRRVQATARTELSNSLAGASWPF